MRHRLARCRPADRGFYIRVPRATRPAPAGIALPTLITHAVVGLTLGRILVPRRRDARFLALSAVVSALPDADALLFSLGLADGAAAHRGLSHSLFFAACCGIPAALLAGRRDAPPSPARGLGLWAYFAAVVASHGLLDALTNGGQGIALLAPFDERRFFLPFRPIEVAPLRIGDFLGAWGARVLASEVVWVWVPLLLAWVAARRAAPGIRGRRERRAGARAG